MKIHLLRDRATLEQITDMREALGSYIKIAADVAEGIVAGGGEMHYDCEQVLLENGSQQENVWGANWYPDEKRLEFEALINIRPHQNNRTMLIQDPELRTRIERLVRSIFEGTFG